MKGIKLAKRIIISLLILLSASICVLVPLKNNLKEKQTQASSYTFGTNDATKLAAATEYYIDSAEGYKEFAASLWTTYTSPAYGGAKPITSVVKETSYINKTVYLKQDIHVLNTDAGWYDGLFDRLLLTFDGTFDGQGNTIYYDNVTDASEGGFCYHLTGTVKNLKIKNIEFLSISTLFRHWDGNWGMIAQKNEGTIENCIVENAKFISRNYKSDLNVAPLVGNNAGTVKNCIVTGKYEIGGYSWNFMSNPDGCYAYYLVASGTAATNCIFNATVTKVGDYTEHCIAPSEHDSLGGNFSSYASAYESMTTDVSTTSGEEGTAWFKYKSGCGYNKDTSIPVYLRSYIDWSTIVFEAETGGMVSSRSIDVPADYISATENGANITIYDKTITATVTNELYGFESDIWTGSGYSYTANFIQKYIYIQFNDCEGTGVSIDGQSKVLADYMCQVSPHHFKVNDKTWRLLFYFPYNGSTLTGVKYQDMANKYYYVSYKSEMIGDTLYITPLCELKKYNVELS